jgi:hypothetical protein
MTFLINSTRIVHDNKCMFTTLIDTWMIMPLNQNKDKINPIGKYGERLLSAGKQQHLYQHKCHIRLIACHHNETKEGFGILIISQELLNF